MSTTRRLRTVCLHCAALLTGDEREHYTYQCHACVVREHELVLISRSDPDHPDVDELRWRPVDIGLLATR